MDRGKGYSSNVDRTLRTIRMDTYGLKRLSKLRELNAKPEWVNSDLYRLLYCPDIYIVAYERIKSSPGNMTKAADGSTIDGFSMKTVENIIGEMRDQSFQFTRARRIFIPKANGGKRPLSVPSARDKIVQEVIRLILECIYDGTTPTFLDCSHGFRANRGTHSCLKEVRLWHATDWFIEGDIKSCFDLIDHQRLIEVISQRVSDRRFLDLLWKALKAGYLEGNVPKNSVSGTPQGSIVSPILANIFLHELDVFVTRLAETYSKGDKKRANPAYTKITKIRKKIKAGKLQVPLAEMRGLEKNLRRIPSLMHNDPNYISVKYVRYADDWIVAIDGPKELATRMKAEIGDFLRDNLKLTLSAEKTHIRNARTQEAHFLGTDIKVGSGKEPIQRMVKWKTGREVKKRTTGHSTSMAVPTLKIIARLADRGFCDRNGNAISKAEWTVLGLPEIVDKFNSILNGLMNYYSFVNNPYGLKRIQHILQQSAALTFCNKLRIRKPTCYKRFGYALEVITVNKSGTVSERRLNLRYKFQVQAMKFSEGEGVTDKLKMQVSLRSRSKLEEDCCICGAKEDVVMHHVRHVRKTQARGFAKVLSAINRKQIPVCRTCHQSIHDGKYDGKNLGDFANPRVASR